MSVWLLSWEILFCTLSFQCRCFQQQFAYNLFWKTPSLYCLGMWAVGLLFAASSPPVCLRHLLDRLLLPSPIDCLSLPICPIRNKSWIGFAQLLLGTPKPMCSCQDGGEATFLPMAQAAQVDLHCLHSKLKAKELNSLSVMRLFSALKESELWTRRVRTEEVKNVSWVLWKFVLVFSTFWRRRCHSYAEVSVTLKISGCCTLSLWVWN